MTDGDDFTPSTKASPRRDNYWRMMKQGRFRALRNLPVGWVMQILHSTDRSDRWFRILFEVVGVVLAVLALHGWLGLSYAESVLYGFVSVHTVFWFLFGNFWVYMLDSFKWVKNPGIDSVMRYTDRVGRWFAAVDCCDAVLIYGSMCRGQFHGRSDLDLRILRRTDSWRGFLALPLSLVLRAYGFFILMPVDFQVVDSMEFLDSQMRKDERPIVVYKRNGAALIPDDGLRFNEVMMSPSIVLKETNASKSANAPVSRG